MSFSGEVFDGTSLNIGDGKAYSKLKRSFMALLCLLTIMTGLLITLWIAYDAAPRWRAQYTTHYDNASIVNLDLNPHRHHGICMPNPDQSFMLWVEGDLVAVGGNGCNMDFVGQDLQTPACVDDMWVAIQAVDSEVTSVGGHSKGGIKAAMKWCGHDVATDETWECSTVAERGWQKPVADGYDPRMEFEDAHLSTNCLYLPYSSAPSCSLDCRHRELPSCSWVRRNTAVVSDLTECPAGYTGALCKQEALLADCSSRNTAEECSGKQWAEDHGLKSQGKADYENRGVCRWEPNDREGAPCGEGKCVLDLTCTHFSAADTVHAKEVDKQGKTDDISNVLDSESAKWIWVDKDTKEWRIHDANEGPGSCSWCGREERSNDPCGEDECRSVDPACKWDPARSSGATSDCRVEEPVLDEDTVYCRKHVKCSDNQLDPETHQSIVCTAAAEDQRRNLTLGCGQCQMCKNLAYQSPGDKATTRTCIQAYNEPCEASYRHSACIDPLQTDAERAEKALGPCPMHAKADECAKVEGCQFVPAIEEEGTTCPEKWGGVFPKLNLEDDSASGTRLFYTLLGMFMMSYMFVGFHIICDDFFVPALNVLCEKLGIPDDVAGATFMAAGASSPELFASLIGVITHSAVGAGTVVGSELFNMLCIVGGVCLVTPIPLTLDWRPLAREVFFFTISLVGIISALADEEVTLAEALVLISGYAAYVAVCAKYKTLMRIFCPATGGTSDEEFYIDFNLEEPSNGDGMDASLTGADAADDLQVQLNGAAMGMDYGDVLMHGFLYKKSDFYSKAHISKNVWQKRWVVLDDEKLFYTRKSGKDRVLIASPSTWSSSLVRSTTYTEFQVSTIGNDFVFKASSPAAAKKWVKLLSQRIEYAKTLSPASAARGDQNAAEEHHDEEDHHNLLDAPESGGAKAFFYFVYPMLFIFAYTIPDVRKAGNSNWYPVTMLMSVTLMALMANVMMTGAESSGCLLGIPEDVMGLTVTAAGTSLPNLFASLMVAQQGLGNMAVSNAFGSNTFNIFVALAIPWLVGAVLHGQAQLCPSMDNNFYTYHVTAGKIGQSCAILGGVLAMMVFILVVTNMKLTKEVGYFFNIVYFVIIGWLVLG